MKTKGEFNFHASDNTGINHNSFDANKSSFVQQRAINYSGNLSNEITEEEFKMAINKGINPGVIANDAMLNISNLHLNNVNNSVVAMKDIMSQSVNSEYNLQQQIINNKFAIESGKNKSMYLKSNNDCDFNDEQSMKYLD